MTSIKSVKDVFYYSMEIGAQAVTAPTDILRQLTAEPTQTTKALQMFNSSWATVEDNLFKSTATNFVTYSLLPSAVF